MRRSEFREQFINNGAFQQRILDRDPSAVAKIDSALSSYSGDTLQLLSNDIIGGITEGDNLWSQAGRQTAAIVFSRIPFYLINRAGSWKELSEKFINGLQTHKDSSNSGEPIDQLLDVGKSFAHYLGARVKKPFDIINALDSITIETDLPVGESITPQPDKRIEDIKTAIMTVSIEANLQSGDFLEGSTFGIYKYNPTISTTEVRHHIAASEPANDIEEKIKRRQTIFFEQDVQAEEFAERFQTEIGQIYIDYAWLEHQGYISRGDTGQGHLRFRTALARRWFVLKHQSEPVPVLASVLNIGLTAVNNDLNWLRGNGYDVFEQKFKGKTPSPEIEEERMRVLQYASEDLDEIATKTNIDRARVRRHLEWLRNHGHNIRSKKKINWEDPSRFDKNS